VILIMIVLLDLPVEVKIADSFIRRLPAIWIAATRSQELGQAMMVIFAGQTENAH